MAGTDAVESGVFGALSGVPGSLDHMDPRPLRRRMLLWIALIVFATFTLASSSADAGVVSVGPIDLNLADPVFLLGLIMGSRALARSAGRIGSGPVGAMSTLVMLYLFYQVLVVIPVALWLGSAGWTSVVRSILIRFLWGLFPVVFSICADDRLRRMVGVIVAAAATLLVVYGLFLAATGGGGFYVEGGVQRFRILSGLATALFAWPLILGLSGAVPRRWGAFLVGIALVGQVLTNHRSGLVAFLVGGFACLWMSGRLGAAVRWLVPLLVMGALVALAWGSTVGSVVGYTLTRLLDFTSGTGADRLFRWRASWDYLVSRPLNDWVWSWQWYIPGTRIGFVPHNFALEVGVTEGVAGLAFYGSMLVIAFRSAWEWVRRDAEVRAIVGFLITYLIYSLANANWYSLLGLTLLVTALGALVTRVDELREGERLGLDLAM